MIESDIFSSSPSRYYTVTRVNFTARERNYFKKSGIFPFTFAPAKVNLNYVRDATNEPRSNAMTKVSPKQLKERITLLEAQLKAITPVVTECRGKTYAAVALPQQVAESIQEKVDDIVHRGFGNGTYLSGNYEQGGEYQHEIFEDSILPGYGGFVAQGWASSAEGWCLNSIFGLVEIPHTCRVCRKPTLHAYNCEACS